MRINTNIAALNSYNQLKNTQNNLSKSLERLSSGKRINRAADDAAGLAISEKMNAQVRGLSQAQRNAQDGISMIQTAEGALKETHSILQRMRELSVQAANDTNTLEDRTEIQKEVNQLTKEIDRIAGTTEFNTQKLLNGSLGAEATSADTGVATVESATGLKLGDYNVNVTTVATKASAVAGSTDFSAAQDVSADELTINGTKIDFSGMTSADTSAIVSKINEYTEDTGVVASASGDSVKLDQTEFGSEPTISLGGAEAAEYGGAVTAGVDAVADITDPDGISQTITGKGQTLSYGSAEFTATATTTGSTTVTVTSNGASFQIGSNKSQNMLIDVNEMSSATLGDSVDGFVNGVDLTSKDGANDAIKTLDNAIAQVSSERSKLGAFQNRLDHTINNLNTAEENLTAAESRISDVDMAKEMMSFTKNQILSQAGTAMMAQANQLPQGVLQLLQ